MRAPPLLAAGSRVALIAPSGPLTAGTDVERALETTRGLGWDPVVGMHALDADGYLAGSDADRVADLNYFARDDSIDAIWCIRGGYGAMRLLHDIDYDAWRQRPRALIGFSDITALHSAIGSRAHLITYHGPTARNELSDFSHASFVEAVATPGPRTLTAADGATLRPGRATGRLAGGNLALIASLTGTPYAVNLDGAILVLEDVNEAVYRIDRMLTQLRLAGVLNSLAGIAFGQFSEIPEDVNEGRPLEAVLQETADRCGVPCLGNIPIGHIPDQWTLPLGQTAVLDADSKTLTIGSATATQP